MKAVCGTNCEECDLYKKKCDGCIESNACPFGKKCWIAKYVELGGEDSFQMLKKKLIDEINSLDIEGMLKIDELYPLRGDFVNLEYPLHNGNSIKFLCDDENYLGNQVECVFNDDTIKKCYGIVCNMSFILVCEYGVNGSDPEIIIYKKR